LLLPATVAVLVAVDHDRAFQLPVPDHQRFATLGGLDQPPRQRLARRQAEALVLSGGRIGERNRAVRAQDLLLEALPTALVGLRSEPRSPARSRHRAAGRASPGGEA